MGQSLSQLYVHLIYSTRNRQPSIKQELEAHLYAYIAGILKALESPSIVINSVPDHIHILFRLSKNYALAKVVEEIKKQSSKWVKDQPHEHQKFSWQSGYAAFSVSSSKLETVRQYIISQKEHHKKLTFKEEVEEFIRKYDIMEYDERYFWD